MFKILLILLLAGASGNSYAFGVGAGLAAVDDMSDGAQPAAVFQLAWTNTTFTQLYYWGRDFGPVTERQGMLTLGMRKTFPGMSFFAVRYGLVALVQKTSLYDNASSRNRENAPAAETETNYNGGGVLGIGVPYALGPVRMELNWDSHIFMVGGTGFIFLASARRQTLGLTFGVEI